jgi:tetratricopeptide (TPR) repeat protein
MAVLQDEKRDSVQYQAALKNFEVATRHLQRQNFQRAKEIFEKLARGAASEIADRARVHLRFCNRKLSQASPSPKLAEDYYNLAVAALNFRKLDLAIDYLNRADRIAPNQEYIQYALAAAHALLGNTDAALEHLKTSIGLRPANRFHARHDPDFQSIATDSRFIQLVGSQTLHAV